MAIVEQIDRALREQVGKVCKQLTAEVVAEIVEDNPFRTGWSASNWISGTGAPPVEPVGTQQSVSTAEREGALAVIVSTYNIDQGVITVQNNVPYITTINDFHPVKAGFVQTGIDRAVNNVIAQSARLVRG